MIFNQNTLLITGTFDTRTVWAITLDAYNAIVIMKRFEADGSGNQKMHRHIENDDVISYSSGAKKNRFHLVKDEDVDYRQGTMQHSSGSILVEPQNIQNEGKKEMSVSKALSSRGSYTMDLQQCYTPAKHRQSRQRRGLNRKMRTIIIEEDLKAKIDTGNPILHSSSAP